MPLSSVSRRRAASLSRAWLSSLALNHERGQQTCERPDGRPAVIRGILRRDASAPEPPGCAALAVPVRPELLAALASVLVDCRASLRCSPWRGLPMVGLSSHLFGAQHTIPGREVKPCNL